MEALSSSTSTQPASQESGRRLHGFTLFSVITALMLTLLLCPYSSSFRIFAVSAYFPPVERRSV